MKKRKSARISQRTSQRSGSKAAKNAKRVALKKSQLFYANTERVFDKFTLFPKLPLSIRQAIWDDTLPPPRTLHLKTKDPLLCSFVDESVCDSRGETPEGPDWTRVTWSLGTAYRRVNETAVCYANRESRERALKNHFQILPTSRGAKAILFNPKTDLLFMDSFNYTSMDDLVRHIGLPSKLLSNLSRLVLNNSDLMAYWFELDDNHSIEFPASCHTYQILLQMPNLKEIIFCFNLKGYEVSSRMSSKDRKKMMVLLDEEVEEIPEEYRRYEFEPILLKDMSLAINDTFEKAQKINHEWKKPKITFRQATYVRGKYER